MKNLLFILAITSFYGCVYDPPHGVFTVHNNSNSVMYVYVTCADSLELTPKLSLYEQWEFNKDNARNLEQNSDYPPDYRIKAYSYSEFAVWGTPKKPRCYCKDKTIRLFFINQSTMRTKQWEKICKKHLYVKKVILTEEQLSKVDWVYTYYPK